MSTQIKMAEKAQALHTTARKGLGGHYSNTGLIFIFPSVKGSAKIRGRNVLRERTLGTLQFSLPPPVGPQYVCLSVWVGSQASRRPSFSHAATHCQFWHGCDPFAKIMPTPQPPLRQRLRRYIALLPFGVLCNWSKHAAPCIPN